MMMGSSDGLGLLMPIQLNHAAAMAAEMVATSGGGSPRGRAKEERLPQWSQQETRDFIEIRGELERDFTVSKRNRTLWEVVASRMKERGYRRNPDQCKCKWKNLVNRYKGKETSDPDNGKQCPFFEELHAVFTERARNMQRLLESETGTPNRLKKKLKRPGGDKSSDELSEDEEEDEHSNNEQQRLARNRKRKVDKVQQQHQQHRGSDKSKAAASNGVHELLQDFFHHQQHAEARWRDSLERMAQERRMLEQEWRQSMEKLGRERLLLEQAWHQREDERRIREESRAVKRDAMLTTLLNKLIQEDL